MATPMGGAFGRAFRRIGIANKTPVAQVKRTASIGRRLVATSSAIQRTIAAKITISASIESAKSLVLNSRLT